MNERDDGYPDVFEDEVGEHWELDPNDPRHPDFDLSEAGYGSDRRHGFFPLRRGVVLLVTVIIIFALFWPFCARIVG